MASRSGWEVAAAGLGRFKRALSFGAALVLYRFGQVRGADPLLPGQVRHGPRHLQHPGVTLRLEAVK
jgi:hypothetical protein